MFKDFNLNQKDKYYLLFLTVFSCVLVGYYIYFNNKIGIFCSDVYIYLLNSIYLTGKQITYTQNIYLSPLICFITSIFFKLGFVDKNTIYIITGAFAVFGNIGLYLLFRRYFNSMLSLCGCIIYSSLPLYLIWLANGTLDIPAVSMIIWISLFTILAVDINPKYYLPLILLTVLGIFTRYTIILTIPACILYYIYKNGFKINKQDLKYIKIGILIGVVVLIITTRLIMNLSGGSFGAANQISEGIRGVQGSKIDLAYNTDVSYYLSNLPNFISTSKIIFENNPIFKTPTILSWTIIGILVIGMSIWINEHKRKIQKKDAYPILFFLLAIISFTKVSSIITTLFVLIGLYLIGRKSENKLEYFMLAWILSNIIFYSYYNIKVSRYFLPAFPPIIYFIILSIEKIPKITNILSLILIILFIIQAFTLPLIVTPTDEYKSTEYISNYITENITESKNITIGVYNLRPYSWWIGDNIYGISSENKAKIDSSNLSYYISNKQLNNLENYSQIKSFGELKLYEKRSV